MKFDIPQLVDDAEKRIRPYVRETFVESSPTFSKIIGGHVHFKCENLQHTGSFKARGALNKILSLSEQELSKGVVTASSGNHGAAVAYALDLINVGGTVFLPDITPQTKIDNITLRGAKVAFHGQDSGDTEIFARQYADEHGMTYVPPYNDPLVVGGQGTIGMELDRQLDKIDAVFVSVGGGGLISGIAGYLKSVRPEVEIVGVSPHNSQVMFQSLKAGHLIEAPSLPTLSDGTAGGVELDAITFEMCRNWIDKTITVTEEEIASALKSFIGVHHMVIEGAAAAALAALLQQKHLYRDKHVVILLCGANIGLDTLKELL